MFQIIWSIIAGLVIGVIAKLLVPGKQNIPLWLTTLLGIGGAIAGNYISSGLGVRHTSGVDWIRHILQVGVAVLLVLIATPAYHKWKESRAGS